MSNSFKILKKIYRQHFDKDLIVTNINMTYKYEFKIQIYELNTIIHTNTN